MMSAITTVTPIAIAHPIRDDPGFGALTLTLGAGAGVLLIYLHTENLLERVNRHLCVCSGQLRQNPRVVQHLGAHLGLGLLDPQDTLLHTGEGGSHPPVGTKCPFLLSSVDELANRHLLGLARAVSACNRLQLSRGVPCRTGDVDAGRLLQIQAHTTRLDLDEEDWLVPIRVRLECLDANLALLLVHPPSIRKVGIFAACRSSWIRSISPIN
ncbi:hypothetical protein [Yellowstone lake phycodnavirus 2]|uniref:hypothetical protein n=1 Tax=Yellowstone lake phycodnavirus 2 TaxID=1586714 RepID=UPI0006EBDA26|nr:hypothetical protein AR678_gp077 [Yellowstone lake phycodnavirus 2]BAT22351.1 hypothetical protein [Yellowstone lake phycodnavirus 2]